MLKSSLINVSSKNLWVNNNINLNNNNNNNNNNPILPVPTFDLLKLKLLKRGFLHNYDYIFLFTGTFLCKLGWYRVTLCDAT